MRVRCAFDLFGVMDRFGYVYGLKKVHEGNYVDVVESLGAFALDYAHRNQLCGFRGIVAACWVKRELFLTYDHFATGPHPVFRG